jgi:glycosyltransferase involved in cell wall biosynthesis
VTILQINSLLSGGGTDDQVIKLSMGLMTLHHQVIVVGPPSAECSSRLWAARVPIHVLRGNKINFILGLARLIRRECPAIVHVHHGRDYWPTILACWLSFSQPVIVLTRHLAKSPSSWLSKCFLLNRVHACVAVSQYVARVLQHGVDEPDSPVKERRTRPPMRGDHSRIRVIYPGIDLARFRPHDASTQRRAWGLAPTHFVFAVVGAYDFPVGKGQAEFLTAAAMVHHKIPQARFLLIGRGTMGDFLDTEIERLGLTGKAWRTPYCQEMSVAMNAIDCLVHPARGTEAFGLVLIEAFACGKAVIASALDGVTEAFAFGEQGRLIPVLSPEFLAEAFVAEATSPASFDATALHEKLTKNLSLQILAARHEEFYRSLLILVRQLKN